MFSSPSFKSQRLLSIAIFPHFVFASVLNFAVIGARAVLNPISPAHHTPFIPSEIISPLDL